MNRREFLQASALGVATAQLSSLGVLPASGKTLYPALSCDVFVYGSTPGGCAAAIEAARRGCKVILACPKNHPGGMAASGLSTTDAVRLELFGGLMLEFIQKVRAIYARTIGVDSKEWPLIKDGWFYEPSVAEQAFQEMLEAEAVNLQFLRGHHLERAQVKGDVLELVALLTPQAGQIGVIAKTYIDGTYEGDLAGAAKVPCRVGREGRAEHGESLAGIHYMNWRTGEQIMTPDTGEPSPAIQAFCARSICRITCRYWKISKLAA